LSGVANRKIDALLTQVGETVVRRNAKIDARMELLQSTQARQEPKSGHADARAQHHRTHGAERANLTHHVLRLLQGPIRAAKQSLAFRGERDGAIAAHEQLDSEVVFKRVDLLADGGLRKAHVL